MKDKDIRDQGDWFSLEYAAVLRRAVYKIKLTERLLLLLQRKKIQLTHVFT